MKTTVKLTKIGSSYWILVPAFIRNNLNLKEKDLLEVDIKRIEDLETIKSFKCNICGYEFCAKEDEELYCPNCQVDLRENFQEIK